MLFSIQLGPNVSIGTGVTIGAGVRVRESIILHGATLQVSQGSSEHSTFLSCRAPQCPGSDMNWWRKFQVIGT